ncbi:MAG: hypothetical protein QM784_33025 [Polyangiaceae bacterium]
MRQLVLRVFTPLVAMLALAVCLFGSLGRARAAGKDASPSPGTSALITSPRASSITNPVPSGAAAPAAAPAVGSAVAPGPAEATDAAGAAAGNAAEAALPNQAASEADVSTIPVGAGLPVVVHVGVSVLELRSFDDVKGEFEATTDMRMCWKDPRLRFQPRGVATQYEEYRGKVAEEHLEKLWTPTVDVSNRLETIGYVGRRLRIFSDGEVELIVRTTGRYNVDVDVKRFPFDVQALAMQLIVRDDTTDRVAMHFDKDDEEFSRARSTVKLEPWGIGDVDLDGDLVSGWNGDRYSRVTASLMVSRSPASGLTTIFIPLLASLLIPLLTLWMNRPTPEGFEVEAFELANMGIGGLFSVIALSLAVTSSYGSIGGSDNTVTRLFALNYATLAISLAIVVLFYRGNIVLRLFGPYVHEQVFRFMLWAIPLLTLGTSLAFVLVAAC